MPHLHKFVILAFSPTSSLVVLGSQMMGRLAVEQGGLHASRQ